MGGRTSERMRLAGRFWPGALTLVLAMPTGETQAFRAPDHPVALELIRRAGPILATSRQSLRRAGHARCGRRPDRLRHPAGRAGCGGRRRRRAGRRRLDRARPLRHAGAAPARGSDQPRPAGRRGRGGLTAGYTRRRCASRSAPTTRASHLKGELCTLLDELRIEYRDFGTFGTEPVDYPGLHRAGGAGGGARRVRARDRARRQRDRGGDRGQQGARHPLRARRPIPVTARLGREHNDANVLAPRGADRRHRGRPSLRACVPRRRVRRRPPSAAAREARTDRGRGGAGLSLALSPPTASILDGVHGEGAAFAMRLVLRAAEVTRRRAADRHHAGPRRLVPLPRRGDARLRRTDWSTAGRASRIPTTLNVGGGRPAAPGAVSRRPSNRRPGTPPDGPIPRARRAADLHLCALPARRRRARRSASRWRGASRTPSPSATASSAPGRTGTATSSTSPRAITGRVPDAGLHRTDARRATLVLRLADDVPPDLRDADVLVPGPRDRARPARRDPPWRSSTACRPGSPRIA